MQIDKDDIEDDIEMELKIELKKKQEEEEMGEEGVEEIEEFPIASAMEKIGRIFIKYSK